ncbi:45012_t:CDS:2 [Gigaspora margarita]|uniref:45012_t:CDS:1 n=1 Tax=Gigaspora margarita TaxID=4874 RepID=A0ABN7V117_GIGMA|nr:45012_t:CDS:2 [Gigaspora margarita]
MNTLLYLAPGNEYNLSQSQFYGIGIKFDDNYFDFARMSLLATFLQEDKWARSYNPLVLNFIRSTGANIQIVQKIDSLLTTSSSSNHHVSPSSRNVFSTLHSTNTLTNTSSHQINQKLSNTLTRTVLIGSAHGGQTCKVYEELLKSYFENTVVDLLPWYMEISQGKYLELWKSCHKEFKNHESSTKLHKFLE